MKKTFIFITKFLFMISISTKAYASLDHGIYLCQPESTDRSSTFALEYALEYFAVHNVIKDDYKTDNTKKILTLKKLYLIDIKDPIKPGWSTGSKSTLYKINAIEPNLFSLTTYTEDKDYYSSQSAKKTTESIHILNKLSDRSHIYQIESISKFEDEKSGALLGEKTENSFALCFKGDIKDFERR